LAPDGVCFMEAKKLTAARQTPYDLAQMKRVLFAILFSCGAALAQTFPSQPIKMISPFPPGGSVDITARLIAEPLAAQLGAKIVIENRSGASGNIGMEAAAHAKPDGYTLVLNTIPLVTNQSLFDKLGWDPIRDFAPIGMVATSPHVVVVPGKSPAHTLDELLRMARANPGRLTYASAGVGTTFHLCGEMFKEETGTFILHVPYRGGGPAVTDTVGGQVDVSFPSLGAAVPFVKSGALRALAVTDKARSALLPDVPTLQEAGVKGFYFTQWLALLAPAGTPPEIVLKLNSSLRSALGSKEIIEKFQAQAFEAFITTPDEAGKFIASEAQRFARLIKTRGITSD
jgi:tripartite-type tricarboxylate transporter receptor subunit TctC